MKNKKEKSKGVIETNLRLRVLSVFALMLLSFGLLPVRLLTIYGNVSQSAAHGSNRRTVTLATSRGIIYDRNMKRLTADSIRCISAIKPSAVSISELKKILEPEKFSAVSEQLFKGEPLVMSLGNTADCNDILTVPIYNRYNSKRLACHVLGYLGDGDTHGVSGIEGGYDGLLSGFNGTLKAGFAADARKRLLSGVDIEIINDNYNSGGGVVLTIDRECQLAVERAMDSCALRKGAAVMIEVDSGAVVAMASRPTFDPTNVARYLQDENSSLFNRALGAYPVGSVFKPLVAAAAMEQGFEPEHSFYCGGKTESGGVEFGCLKTHGNLNLAGGLAYSCNCYFINLISQIDAKNVVEMASTLGIGTKTQLAQGVTSYAGTLPSSSELESAAARANLSFGQGSLTATPVQIASLYAAIASGGKFYPPYLVEATLNEKGERTSVHEKKPPYILFSRKTADYLNTFLELAVREGTCKTAAVKGVAVCGKTATAQSGEFFAGRERLVSWFAGFYPSDEPKYALVVMCEDGKSGSSDCAPVFSRAITQLTR